MPRQSFRFRVCAFLAGVALASLSSWASADPPSRVARLGYLSGAVSFSPAGENDWVQADDQPAAHDRRPPVGRRLRRQRHQQGERIA